MRARDRLVDLDLRADHTRAGILVLHSGVREHHPDRLRAGVDHRAISVEALVRALALEQV